MDTLKEPVYAGDLLLCFEGGIAATMAIVIEAPDAAVNPNPDTSSIFVQKVSYSLTRKRGCWTLDGPKVYYTPENDETSSYSHSPDDSTHSYDCPKEYRSTDADVEIIVNPHGRDVLAHYFNGCPFCGDFGWTCPGCGGFGQLWPSIKGVCDKQDQSCPVCMGTDFALHDKYSMIETWAYEKMVNKLKSDPNQNDLSPEEMQEWKDEALASVTERFREVHARNQEMGRFDRQNFEDMLEYWRGEYYGPL